MIFPDLSFMFKKVPFEKKPLEFHLSRLHLVQQAKTVLLSFNHDVYLIEQIKDADLLKHLILDS